ncbi:stage III sporulation protein AF [Clostridium beijerinckii]|uniref:stage III sporulation protein AF n=1 Tax=Clostridium beijerinckii TaxID=1520 RepID=UPI00098C97D9|nr:stage III sporulation protein AF [Clostridium beijerinckii]MBA8935758.1 stage III sporulation protein AF [Clostridium beijerinckii]NRU40152.1 stage III sporulation protein AF [Clostridium beijerinckii]NSA96570.1 stage III sporulation protein AF [Clostridium beijerinckii]OOM63747.1 stage III sporulation protein SpoIIIAF [Clostridium beijerinckii]OOM70387.1 stage III sporulation protein SpoIIIAF [Clostridium beijerinckii]
MFMEALKKFVITLVTVLIFMSAVEMIAPSKMKKYIKFVLGLILITIILNPILQFVEGGEKNFTDVINNYEQVFSKDRDTANFDSINTLSKSNKDDERKKAFVANFNKNCDNILKNNFKDMNFKSEVDCDVDFSKVTINVKKLRIGVSSNKINKIKKIVISKGADENNEGKSAEYSEIGDFASNELNIPKEKIEVYGLEE